MGWRALLALEPGLGKTRTAIELVALSGAATALVVAPASMLESWQREFKRWADVDAAVVAGSKKPAAAAVCIVSNDVLWRHAGVMAREWDFLVYDECHLAKSLGKKRTTAVLSLAARVDKVLGLSGTPQLSRPEELYTILHAISRGGFGSYVDFTARYCDGHQVKYGERVVWEARGATNVDELRERMEPFMVRVLKEEGLPALPPKRRHVVELPLGREAEAELATMRLELGELRGQAADPAAGLAEKRAAEAQLMACWRRTSELKMPAVRAWLEAQDPARGLALFGHHGFALDAVEAACGAGAARIDGSVPAHKRQRIVDALREGRAKRGVLSITACGTGITLAPGIAAVAFFEMHWNPSLFLQAEDRCHRIGTVEPVDVYYLLAPRSFDMDMFRLIERKAALNAQVVDGGASALTFA
jgi:SWI/SNF-related matrix-associated actin-dependent regulator 1 of chromatin subfamily A